MQTKRKLRWLRVLARLRANERSIAVLSFLSGAATFFLVGRQPRYARWITLLLLGTWIALLADNLIERYFPRLARARIPRALARYSAQMIHQESFAFVLPFFLVTTTWATSQALFTGALLAAAAVSLFDPLYHRLLVPRRSLYLAYHAFALFVTMLTVLPVIVHLTTGQSYALACVAVVVAAFPSLQRALRVRRRWRRLLLPTLGVALGGAAWLIRPAVPPATLWLAQSAITPAMNVPAREPDARLTRIPETLLRRQGLYAFTAVHAPRGLNEKIYHVWSHDGHVVDRIPLEITGGRHRGYRAWSHKERFPAHPQGRWRVAVVTGSGQLIGVMRFDVTRPRLGRAGDGLPRAG